MPSTTFSLEVNRIQLLYQLYDSAICVNSLRTGALEKVEGRGSFCGLIFYFTPVSSAVLPFPILIAKTTLPFSALNTLKTSSSAGFAPVFVITATDPPALVYRHFRHNLNSSKVHPKFFLSFTNIRRRRQRRQPSEIQLVV